MKIVKHCLFCEGDSCWENLYPQNFHDKDLNSKIFSARRVTEHFHYAMVKCRKTGLVFSREILPEVDLKSLYAQSEVTFSEYTDIIRKDYWRPLEAFSNSMQKGTALEIGCSSGFFLEELLKRGFSEVTGCEPSLEAKVKASDAVKHRIHTGFFSKETFADEAFDLICCFQTLDHLSDPLEMLNTCYQKLRPKGLLYIILHNVDGLQAKIFGEKSPIIDVEHIYLFNPKTLTLAVEKVGLTTLGAFPIKNSYPLKYLVTHSPLPFKRLIGTLIAGFGLNKVSVPLRLGNMGIVAQKP